ncbi:SLAM family member 5-like [Engystomops pustulosus]|uniref:SLAM family member 5-like n=1 Tax=Engystomops pustulosus TaxID=76066 RepID=UPI003AFB44BB
MARSLNVLQKSLTMSAGSLMVFFTLLAYGQASSYRNISGLSNSSITLEASFISPNVIEVMWYHKTTDVSEVLLAKVQNGRLSDKLSDRYMEEDGGRTLKIPNVSKNDSGVYKAEAALLDGTILPPVLYNVTVYDPVPIPDVKHQVKRIGDQYNVTLQCSVPSNRSDISYTWKYRRGDKEYQNLNDTGGTIWMMVPVNQLDMEIMCTAHNPADQKNISTRIQDGEEEVPKRNHEISAGIIAFLAVMVVVAVTVALIWTLKKRISNRRGQGNQSNENENLSSPVQDTGTQESTFIEISLGKTKYKPKEDAEENWSQPF